MKEPKWTTGFVLTNEVCGESNQSCPHPPTPPHFSLPPWQCGKNAHRQMHKLRGTYCCRFKTIICVGISDFLKILCRPATVSDLLYDEYYAVWLSIELHKPGVTTTGHRCAFHCFVQNIYKHKLWLLIVLKRRKEKKIKRSLQPGQEIFPLVTLSFKQIIQYVT